MSRLQEKEERIRFLRRRRGPLEEPPPPRGDLRWGPHKRDPSRFSVAAPWEVREKIADDGTPLYGWGWSAFMGERSMSKDRWMLNAHVAGVTHRVKELQDDAFAPGQRVSLVADPENPYDPNAVEVWDADKRMQVGYLPKGENARVAKHLQDGQEIHALVVWEWRTAGRRTALRVLVSTEAPELSD